MSDNGYITIKEASEFAGVNISTIYRNISNLQCKTVQIGAKKIKYVRKSDIESFFYMSGKENQKHAIASEVSEKKQSESMQNKTNLKESMREVIEEFFEIKQSQLMKPIEEQALYRLGILENEVKHLHAEKETLRQENELLREQVKILPGPAELEVKENTILLLHEELRSKQEKYQKEKESTKQVLLENAQNLSLLQKEKEDLLNKVEEYKPLPEKLGETVRKLQEKEEIDAQLLREKEELETRLKTEAEAEKKKREELEVKLRQESEEKSRLLRLAEKEKIDMEARLMAEAETEKTRLKAESEEEKKHIAEAWKKELELAKKPWWKIW